MHNLLECMEQDGQEISFLLLLLLLLLPLFHFNSRVYIDSFIEHQICAKQLPFDDRPNDRETAMHIQRNTIQSEWDYAQWMALICRRSGAVH